MKRIKKLFFYISLVGGFTFLVFLIIEKGKKLETITHKAPAILNYSIRDALVENLTHPLAILLLQIATIIVVARFFSWICKKISQPAVIGEIIAGIILGPSLLGIYFPGIFSSIFPETSMANLQFLSQIGLILFMFVIGMELDLDVIKNQAKEAIVISHASIVIPFTLGTALAYYLYNSFAPAGISFLSFGLFLGISMSITAFPVLARIVLEKGIHKTPMGTIAITCAAVDDVTAWSLLAMVIAIVKAGAFTSSLLTICLAIAYVVIALKLVKPFLKRIGDLHDKRENIDKSVVAIFFLVLIGSSYLTEIIGIHALFGAFMAGVIMPDNRKFKQLLIEKIEDIALVLLLPLFFVFTGLRTQVGLLNSPGLWLVCGLVILVAVAGKFGGSAAAARIVGQGWKESLTIGALMNTRGLVELVALNIGYDLGILTPEIFTMLVIMALVTTLMTSPSLSLIEKAFAKKKTYKIPETDLIRDKIKILISFANPEMGRVLLRLIQRLFKEPERASITALHLFTGNLFSKYKLEDYEKESFTPILNESKKHDLQIMTVFKVSDDINKDIIEEANHKYNLLLIGIGQSIYEGTILGRFFGTASRFFNPAFTPYKGLNRLHFDDRTNEIIRRSVIPVGILINRGFSEIKNLLLVLTDRSANLIQYTLTLIRAEGIRISIVDLNGYSPSDNILKKDHQIPELENIEYINSLTMLDKKSSSFDLIVISLDGWLKLSDTSWMHRNSVLIVALK